MISSSLFAADPATALALGPEWLDPTYLLGQDGPFGAFVLPGMLLIVFVETGLLFPLLPGDSLLFRRFPFHSAKWRHFWFISTDCRVIGTQRVWIGAKVEFLTTQR